jgi:outer membrane protein assembly factor BamB
MRIASIVGLWLGRVLVWLVLVIAAFPAAAESVLSYHGRANRSGNYTIPELTWEHAHALRLDAGFAPRFEGHLYAQPLYWRPPGASAGLLIVASESDVVTAIDAASGNAVWTRTLGRPAPLSTFGCGNIDPLGITGTPVIDESGGALYLDAMTTDPSGPRHRLFALSLKDGTPLPGWPIDVADALRAKGETFDPKVQNQRGALAILNGTLYVPYGGFYGDCGDYHGWVVGVPLADPQRVISWRTRGRGAGIWAPGGIASDGVSLYVATGNTVGARDWADGEAVFRLSPDLRHSERSADFFAASDWRALDSRDADLGGSNPLPFDLPGGPPVVLALGKDEKAYLIDRSNLGGFGGSLLAERVSTYPIRTAPAAYRTADAMFVALQGHGAPCPNGQGGDLTVLRIAANPRPAIATAWCGAVSGAGSPIVTTTDGTANPIVWMLGAEGDNRLYGFRGDTGEKLFASPPLAGLRHFQTLIAADDRLFVGADGRLYSFSLSP